MAASLDRSRRSSPLAGDTIATLSSEETISTGNVAARAFLWVRRIQASSRRALARNGWLLPRASARTTRGAGEPIPEDRSGGPGGDLTRDRAEHGAGSWKDLCRKVKFSGSERRQTRAEAKQRAREGIWECSSPFRRPGAMAHSNVETGARLGPSSPDRWEARWHARFRRPDVPPPRTRGPRRAR